MVKKVNTFEYWLDENVRNNYKHYYLLLTNEEKQIYDKLLDAFIDFRPTATIGLINIDDLSRISQMLYRDNPLIFYVDTWSLYTYSDKCVVEIKYSYSKNEAKEIFLTIKQVCDEMYLKTERMSDFRKLVTVHDYILENVTYLKDEMLPIYKGHSMFIYGKAVCAGISKSAQILLSAVGLKSTYIRGYSHDFYKEVNIKEDLHAWNIVWVENRPFHMDFTFDNSLTKNCSRKRYDYFMLSDRQISVDHVFESIGINIRYDNDWYIMSDRYYTDRNKLIDFIKKQINLDVKRIHFKIGYCDDPREEFIGIKKLVLDEIWKHNKYMSALTSTNEEQMIMDIELVKKQ